jgi:hypothetical protein
MDCGAAISPSDRNVTGWLLCKPWPSSHAEKRLLGSGSQRLTKPKHRSGSTLGREVFAHNHLKPSFGSGVLALGVDVSAVEPNYKRFTSILERPRAATSRWSEREHSRMLFMSRTWQSPPYPGMPSAISGPRQPNTAGMSPLISLTVT